MGDRAREISAGFRGDNGGENELFDLLKKMGYGVKEAAKKAKDLLSETGRDAGVEMAIRRKLANGESLNYEERLYEKKYMGDSQGIGAQEPSKRGSEATVAGGQGSSSEKEAEDSNASKDGGRVSGSVPVPQRRSTGGSDPYANSNPNGRSEVPGPGVSFGPGRRGSEGRGRTALTQEDPEEEPSQGRTALTGAAEDVDSDVLFSFDPEKKNTQDDRVKVVQETLEEQGFSVGPDGADGWFGRDTSSAVKKFQSENGLPATGNLDKQTAEALGIQW